jgi:hypothetical protein
MLDEAGTGGIAKAVRGAGNNRNTG